MQKSLHGRILARIDSSDPDACWLWPGAKTNNGYGVITQYQAGGGYQGFAVHRVLYTHLVGPVPEGLDLDHLCRVRACCNPRHLEPVTRRENSHRGAKYRPVACPRGHAYTPENTYLTKAGHIRCRECNREQCRRRRQLSAEQAATEPG